MAGFIEVSAGHPNASAKAGVWERRRGEERRGHRRRGEERCVDTQRTVTEDRTHTEARRGVDTQTHIGRWTRDYYDTRDVARCQCLFKDICDTCS